MSQELVLQCYERVVAGYELSLTRPHALFPVADVKTQWWCVIEAEQREKERLRIEAEEKAAKAAEKAANKGKNGDKGKKDDKKGKQEEKGGKNGKGSGEPASVHMESLREMDLSNDALDALKAELELSDAALARFKRAVELLKAEDSPHAVSGSHTRPRRARRSSGSGGGGRGRASSSAVGDPPVESRLLNWAKKRATEREREERRRKAQAAKDKATGYIPETNHSRRRGKEKKATEGVAVLRYVDPATVAGELKRSFCAIYV